MGRLSPLGSTIELPEVGHESEVRPDRGWIVVVYDNDKNSFEEVIMILVLATGCTLEEAEIETWEVHHLGKSVVHSAGEEECRKVAEVIQTIGIRVEVIKED